MAQQERIARLLANGFEPELVAKITNVPLPYLSTLLADDEFRARVEYESLAPSSTPDSPATQEESEVVSLKDSLLAAEQRALMSLHERMTLMEDRNLIAAFQTIGARRDSLAKSEALSKAVQNTTNGSGVPTVVINLPNIVIPELIMSSQREVVGIGERSTVPMGRERLTALIEGELEHEQLST